MEVVLLKKKWFYVMNGGARGDHKNILFAMFTKKI